MSKEIKIAIEGYNEEKMEILRMIDNAKFEHTKDKLYQRLGEIDEKIKKLFNQ